MEVPSRVEQILMAAFEQLDHLPLGTGEFDLLPGIFYDPQEIYYPYHLNEEEIDWDDLQVFPHQTPISNAWFKNKANERQVLYYRDSEGFLTFFVRRSGLADDKDQCRNCQRNFVNTVNCRMATPATRPNPALRRPYGGQIIGNFFVAGPRHPMTEEDKHRLQATKEKKRKSSSTSSSSSSSDSDSTKHTKKIRLAQYPTAQPPVAPAVPYPYPHPYVPLYPPFHCNPYHPYNFLPTPSPVPTLHLLAPSSVATTTMMTATMPAPTPVTAPAPAPTITPTLPAIMPAPAPATPPATPPAIPLAPTLAEHWDQDLSVFNSEDYLAEQDSFEDPQDWDPEPEPFLEFSFDEDSPFWDTDNL